MGFLGFGLGAPRRRVEPVVPPHWNYPPSTAGDTGIVTMPVPKGLSAAPPMHRPDVALDQRISERITAFSPRLPMQTWLRQQKVVQVVPQQASAHRLQAAPKETVLDTAYTRGMYDRDYTLLTQMGVLHAGSLRAPYRLQSVPGYTDVGSTVAINGQYASINANLSVLYTNLRAPKPFEGQLTGCQ